MFLGTREFVTAVTKRLSSGAFSKPHPEEATDNAGSAVRELLQKGDALLREEQTELALETYALAAEDYVTRDHLVQAVAVYKRMLQIDDTQENVRTQLADLHVRLGVADQQ